jgi:transposase
MTVMEQAMAPMHGREAHYDRISAPDIAPFWEQLDWPAAARLAIHQRLKGGLLTYLSCEARVPENHPLRAIRPIVDEVLEVLSPQLEGICANTRGSSMAPEKLLRSLLLEAIYTIRSERQLIEQLSYNLLFRWFVGLSIDAPIWDVTAFTKNREQLLASDVNGALPDPAAIDVEDELDSALDEHDRGIDRTQQDHPAIRTVFDEVVDDSALQFERDYFEKKDRDRQHQEQQLMHPARR